MKGKQKSLISFYIGGLVLLAVWYFSVRHWRSADIDSQKINSVKSELDQLL